MRTLAVVVLAVLASAGCAGGGEVEPVRPASSEDATTTTDLDLPMVTTTAKVEPATTVPRTTAPPTTAAPPTAAPTTAAPTTAAPSTAAPQRYANCTEMRKDHPNGVQRGHPAYEQKHDRDNDGHACEP